jgi:hypothetical protein
MPKQHRSHLYRKILRNTGRPAVGSLSCLLVERPRDGIAPRASASASDHVTITVSTVTGSGWVHLRSDLTVPQHVVALR